VYVIFVCDQGHTRCSNVFVRLDGRITQMLLDISLDICILLGSAAANSDLSSFMAQLPWVQDDVVDSSSAQ
jgi:hypothetical protein